MVGRVAGRPLCDDVPARIDADDERDNEAGGEQSGRCHERLSSWPDSIRQRPRDKRERPAAGEAWLALREATKLSSCKPCRLWHLSMIETWPSKIDKNVHSCRFAGFTFGRFCKE